MSNNSYYNDAWRIINEKNKSLVSNYSMDFDGSNDFVTISDPIKFTGDFTISAWIYPTRVDDGYEMIYTQGTPIIQVAPYFAIKDTRLHVYIAGVIETELNFITPNKWQHVAVTRSSAEAVSQGYPATAGGITLFIDGVQSSLTVVQGGTFNTNSNGIIGKWNSNTHYFKGKIDQFCIFDYALPATGTNSVATLYGGGTAVTNPMALSPAPVAYYQLGDQTASNNTTEPTPPVQSYLVSNNSLQDYVFDFDGSDDYIDLSVSSSSSVPSEQSSWTYSAWLYLDSAHTESFPTIFQRGTGYPGSGMLVRESGGNIQVFTGTALTFFSVNKLLTNEWSYFALVYDISTNELTCYINNSSQTLTMVSGWSISGTRFNIGFRQNNSGYWKGEMSNVQVFNTALSATGSNSIETIYNNGSPLTSMSGFTSLQSWYKLNAEDVFVYPNWVIRDSAGSNDGTSSGMTSANLVQSDLQHTSGFSPYALSFDSNNANQLVLNNGNGNGLLNAATSFTISAWINPTQPTANATIFSHWLGGILIRYAPNGTCQMFVTKADGSFTLINSLANKITFNGDWQNFVATYDGVEIKMYINNALIRTPTAFTSALFNDTTSTMDIIGGRGSEYFNGKMSNVAIWKNSVINVATLYNQGVPGDLTSLNPSGWWQMGSNSSFNSGVWTCLNQGTGSTSAVPANATSTATMAEDDITNGVGYSGNGLGTSSIEIVGDAPYSTANSISNSMDVLSRSTDLPN